MLYYEFMLLISINWKYIWCNLIFWYKNMDYKKLVKFYYFVIVLILNFFFNN